MRQRGPATHVVLSAAMWLLIILFSPVILMAGEPVNRYVMRRVRRDAAPVTGVTVAGHGGRPALVVESSQLPLPVFLLFRATSDPLWIALTAPGRWVGDRSDPGFPRSMT